MAKVIKFLTPYQVASLLKLYQTYQTILEDLIDEGDIVALYIDEELDRFGYGSWEDPEYGEGFLIPPTRILTDILSRIMEGGKIFIPVDEELIKFIPNPPKKWRWRQVDKCHRRWGWVA